MPITNLIFPAPAPAPQSCRICDRSTVVPVYSLGRRLLLSQRLPCCPETQGTSFCSSPRCTLYLVSGLLAVILGGMVLAFTVAFVRMRFAQQIIHVRNATASMLEAAPQNAGPVYKAIEVATPPGSTDFLLNCPVCWDDITDSALWRDFPCTHGTCAKCHEGLISPPGTHSNCPLCRFPLAAPHVPSSPVPTDSESGVPLEIADGREGDSSAQETSARESSKMNAEQTAPEDFQQSPQQANGMRPCDRIDSVTTIPIFAFAGTPPNSSSVSGEHADASQRPQGPARSSDSNPLSENDAKALASADAAPANDKGQS